MKRILTAVLAGATVLTLTVGCSVQQSGPKLKVVLAARDLAAAGQAGFTVRAGGQLTDLIAAARKNAVADGRPFTAEDARLLRGIYRSSLTIAWDKAGRGAADDRSMASAVVDGVVGAEARVVDQVTYVRVPVYKLAAKFGVPRAQVNAVRRQLGPTTAGVGTLFHGGWVRINPADMDQLVQSTAGGAPQGDPQQGKKYAAELMTSAENLLKSATVTYDKKDRRHLIVTTSTAQAHREARRLVNATKKITDEPAAAALLEETVGADPAAPVDQPIVLDLWIDKGRFQALEINLLQFVKGASGRAGLRVEFFRGRDIAAPVAAAKLDLPRIMQAMTEGQAPVLAGGSARRAHALAGIVGS